MKLKALLLPILLLTGCSKQAEQVEQPAQIRYFGKFEYDFIVFDLYFETSKYHYQDGDYDGLYFVVDNTVMNGWQLRDYLDDGFKTLQVINDANRVVYAQEFLD